VCWAVNRKVVGSSPSSGAIFLNSNRRSAYPLSERLVTDWSQNLGVEPIRVPEWLGETGFGLPPVHLWGEVR